MQNILVWNALIAWRNDLLKKDILRKSKVDYLSNITKLLEIGLLNVEQPLSDFIKINIEDEIQETDRRKPLPTSTIESINKLCNKLESRLDLLSEDDRVNIKKLIERLQKL